jgi:acetylornithine deacetylase/succinyl-diaminopimelate desuccinylase-like protein
MESSRPLSNRLKLITTTIMARLGMVATMVEHLKTPLVLVGIGLPDENAHAPNEKLDLDNLHHGMLSAAYLLEELGETRKGKA